MRKMPSERTTDRGSYLKTETLKLLMRRWIAGIGICWLFSGCAAKGPTPLLEERTLNPFEYGCSCVRLNDAELEHFLLVGDKRLDKWNRWRTECIKNGLLEEEK